MTSNAHALTGDGPAVVWRRGVPLEDMEMFQFHPTGLAKLGVLLSEAARGEGGIVRNKDGERFMERYAPTIKDLAPRDMVSRAIYQEIKEGRGGGPNGDWAYLDITHLDPKVIEEKLPDITEFARVYLKVEPTKEPVPIQPTAHYAMGGIPTDTDGRVVVGPEETPVPGLYAAGECACVSVHGANRLGTNSLLDLVVFGRRAGGGRRPPRRGGRARRRCPSDPTERTLAMLERHPRRGPRATTPPTSARSCRTNMFDLAFVVRSEEGLAKMAGDPRRPAGALRAGRDHRQGRALQHRPDGDRRARLPARLREALVVSARARTESRGGHYREDHPLRDDANWLRHTLAYRNDDGSIRLDFKPVKMGPYVPMERKY